jgi:RNA polymerase sigma-70 factor, ECF subfamily
MFQLGRLKWARGWPDVFGDQNATRGSLPWMGDRSLAYAEPNAPHADQSVPIAGPNRIQSVVAAYFDFVWRMLRRLGVAPGLVDDAAQEVFMVAGKGIGNVPPPKEKSYLFAIALRIAAQVRRSQNRQREVSGLDVIAEVADGAPGPDELLDKCRARLVMDQILETIPFDQRVVFVLFEMEEMTTLRISEFLGIPQGTVASRLRRSRELFFQAVDKRRARGERAGV